ncbi:MAG: STAS/SEC14 domain-containing protein [Deltaproteobacteria bacterium]|nr:STAS/SEC14 domain-containing protein [Deltaproteobacteria bacterium]
MFKVERVNNRRLDVKISGKIDAEQMKVALEELLGQSEDIRNGTMLYEVVDFHFPSLAAITIELSRLPELFGLRNRFDRAAVLTDENWIKKASEIKGWLLYPGLEIKAFTHAQKAEAEAWLATGH